MNRVTPKLRDLAELLLRFEAQTGGLGPTLRLAILVCEKLASHLATFLGSTGARALVARALALTQGEISSLRGVRVSSEGAWEGIDGIEAQTDRDKSSETGVILVGELLGLLTTLIGEGLTVRIVSQVWSLIPLEELNDAKDDKIKHQRKG